MRQQDKRAKVLVVDDEKIDIDVLVASLKADYRTSVAKNGEQALWRLQKPP